MKLNDAAVTVSLMHVEQVDGSFIIHDEDAHRVIMMNRTASLIWEMICEHWNKKQNIATQDLVIMLADRCEGNDLDVAAMQRDVEEVIAGYFRAGLLQAS